MKFRILLSVCLFLCFTPFSSYSAVEYTIIAPHVSSNDNYNHLSLEVFKNHVESRSNGRIQVEIYPGGQLCGNAKECLAGVQAGMFDYFQTTVSELANYWKPMGGFDLPYLLRDDRVAECVYDDETFLKEIRKEVLQSANGLRLMMVSNSGGWRNIATTKKQVKKPEDVKGLKLRTVPAPIQQELVKQLGGAPTPVSWSETYTALSTGVVDGTKNGIVDIIQMHFNESLKYIILDGHAYMGGVWVMNDSKFQKMPKELRKVVIDAVVAQNQYLRAYPKWKEFSAIQEFIKTGGTVYNPSEKEKDLFKQATSNVRNTYLKDGDANNKLWLNKFEEVVKKCETKLDSQYDLELTDN